MIERGFWELNALDDAELECELGKLVARGRAVDARVVAHLAEVEARQLHLKRGAASLFVYCVKELNLSENQAFYRIAAARVGRRFPVVFGMLERGELHLSSVALLSKHLTVQNHELLLGEARWKTKLQILELLAKHVPQADVANTIRMLARPSLTHAVAAGPTGALAPLSPTSYRLQLNISQQLKCKLELARDLLSHSNPSGDLSIVVECALDLLIARLQSQRFGQLKTQSSGENRATAPTPAAQMRDEASPDTRDSDHAELRDSDHAELRDGHAELRDSAHAELRDSAHATTTRALTADARLPQLPAAPTSNTRNGSQRPRDRRAIPRETRRRLIERDGACCSFIGEDGERCSSSAFLQIHHVRAWAKGGTDTLDNLRLLCAAHNRLLGELEFGQRRRAS